MCNTYDYMMTAADDKKKQAELNEVQRSCGFDKQDVEDYNHTVEHMYDPSGIGLFTEISLIPSHPYRAEYLLFLKYMNGRTDYCVRDFFSYANNASSDVDWMYDGHEHLFKGTQLEADKEAGLI